MGFLGFLQFKLKLKVLPFNEEKSAQSNMRFILQMGN